MATKVVVPTGPHSTKPIDPPFVELCSGIEQLDAQAPAKPPPIERVARACRQLALFHGDRR